MFSKLSVVVASVLITLAAAIPWGTPPPPVTPPHLPPVLQQRRPIQQCRRIGGCRPSRARPQRHRRPVGLSCSPITVAGNNCGSTTVVCDAPDQEWGGLIAINCIPITA
ncbi:hypothetical protein C8F04DRAFT_1236304 [Mycena alexandri]|uniref:Hydrophobin n=1 Tax=Mycena alexandri TaxID=1745969 RepID=A0AAD6SQS3_9AGAR|nr:hypothetical protein C8F04DRAFT_1236304 [Mycena alexandri]